MGIGLCLIFLNLQVALTDLPVIEPDIQAWQAISCLTDVDSSDQQDIIDEDKWFAMDKFWHWAMSFSLTGSTYHLAYIRLEQEQTMALVEAISSTLFFGILKEFYDLYTYGLFSYKDIIYDLLGIICGYFVFIHTYA